jgi:hypothetical protein
MLHLDADSFTDAVVRLAYIDERLSREVLIVQHSRLHTTTFSSDPWQNLWNALTALEAGSSALGMDSANAHIQGIRQRWEQPLHMVGTKK